MTTTPTSGAADLRAAAQAVVDRWDTPLWKDVPATAEYIGRLRAALAAGQATAAQQPATSAAAAEIEALRALSVTNIMLDIVPGLDGMGHEVYAKSVKDVEDKLSAMGQELEDWQLGIRLYQPSPTPQADSQPAPVLWLSPEQFANFVDTDEAEFGKYIPARKTSAGKFTMPLFAARTPADSVTAPAGGAAILKEILAAACCEDSETYLTGDQYRKLYDLQSRIESMPTPPTQAADSVPTIEYLRSQITGMSVSVDVSTGDHDAGHRYFGTVTEVMECQGDKHGVTLLVQDAEPNFKADSMLEDAASAGFFLQLPQRPKPEAPAGTVGLDWDAYSGAQILAYGRDCSNAAIVATQKPGEKQ